ncbi:hypothetical protein FO440_21945 [Mucilaginibacter corticis]|uniref:IPT/TIG domain-containing protein n=1 Tax=Mucilaginibacter corticis TaxID=2597670 RepID=A0A556M9A0_9SPHI|nr:IPT/TIG domain-containing protein [Mucilaginibacter corticis]TSJ36497.1 hypothetical protein FO440_21945 [Mucilaginibacter corticis]
MKSLCYFLRVAAVSLITLTSLRCKKNSPDDSRVTPAIKSISPLQGIAGTSVTISGVGFDTVLSKTSVKINGQPAVVKSVAADQIVAVVPENAGSGEITVMNNNTSLPFSASFTFRSVAVSKIPVDVGAGGPPNVFDGNPITDLAADAAGTLYVNAHTDTVFKISPLAVKTMLAKVGSGGTTLGGTSVDAAGNVYAVGTNDFKIYKITSAGAVSVFAGSGVSGYADGKGASAQFTAPSGMANDPSGNLFVTDVYRVRKITPAGQVSTFAGKATAGKADGQGTAASFGSYGALQHITTDPGGNVYVSDDDPGSRYAQNKAFYIRKITPTGNVTTLGPLPIQSAPWANQGPMSLPFTSLLAADAAGNLFLPGSSYNNGSTASGGCCTFGPIFMSDEALNSSVFYELNNVLFYFITINYTGITFDPAGNLYISATTGWGRRFYEPPVYTGSVILKFTVH